MTKVGMKFKKEAFSGKKKFKISIPKRIDSHVHVLAETSVQFSIMQWAFVTMAGEMRPVYL